MYVHEFTRFCKTKFVRKFSKNVGVSRISRKALNEEGKWRGDKGGGLGDIFCPVVSVRSRDCVATVGRTEKGTRIAGARVSLSLFQRNVMYSVTDIMFIEGNEINIICAASS